VGQFALEEKCQRDSFHLKKGASVAVLTRGKMPAGEFSKSVATVGGTPFQWPPVDCLHL